MNMASPRRMSFYARELATYEFRAAEASSCTYIAGRSHIHSDSVCTSRPRPELDVVLFASREVMSAKGNSVSLTIPQIGPDPSVQHRRSTWCRPRAPPARPEDGKRTGHQGIPVFLTGAEDDIDVTDTPSGPDAPRDLSPDDFFRFLRRPGSFSAPRRRREELLSPDAGGPRFP